MEPDGRRGSGSTRRIAGGWPRTGASCCCSWPTPASAWPGGRSKQAARGPRLAGPGRVDPRPAPIPRSLARPSALLFVAGRCECGPTRPGGARRNARHDRAGSLPRSPRRSPGRAGPRGSRPPSPSWTRHCGGTRVITGRWSSGESATSSEASSSRPRPTSASARASGRNSPGVTSIAAACSTGPADKAAAVLDFTAALDRDPTLVPALVNRGLARLELKEHAACPGRLRPGLGAGLADASVSAGRGIALERLGRHREADAAFADCFAHTKGLPAPARARLAWAYGFAISAREPDKAPAAFDLALRLDPGNSQALYGRAMLAMSRGKNAEAILGFEAALEADPGRIDVRRYRAIALARQGEWTDATEEINRCLKREPRSAATLYAAACVVSLAFEKTDNTAHARQRSTCSIARSRAPIRQTPLSIPTWPQFVVSPNSSA